MTQRNAPRSATHDVMLRTTLVMVVLSGCLMPVDVGGHDAGPCTPGQDQTCNGLASMSALAGRCTATGCECNTGFALNASGRCEPRPACTVGDDATCNENASMSALAGRCTATGCQCNAGFELKASGRCQPSGVDAGLYQCDLGNDSTCNENAAMSALAGTCVAPGNCACLSGFVLTSAGKCRAAPACNQAMPLCVSGTPGGQCGDGAQNPTCQANLWVCPSGTIPNTQCACTGLRPGCTCSPTGWVCPMACTPGVALSCNDVPAEDAGIGAATGVCSAIGACTCNSGFSVNPATGRCRDSSCGFNDTQSETGGVSVREGNALVASDVSGTFEVTSTASLGPAWASFELRGDAGVFTVSVSAPGATTSILSVGDTVALRLVASPTGALVRVRANQTVSVTRGASVVIFGVKTAALRRTPAFSLAPEGISVASGGPQCTTFDGVCIADYSRRVFSMSGTQPLALGVGESGTLGPYSVSLVNSVAQRPGACDDYDQLVFTGFRPPSVVCTTGADQSCNASSAMASFAGTCVAGQCQCNANFVKTPSGKCAPANSYCVVTTSPGTCSAQAPNGSTPAATCGTQSIVAGCRCAAGTPPFPQCLGLCPPTVGEECFPTNCGVISCEAPLRCTAPNVCVP